VFISFFFALNARLQVFKLKFGEKGRTTDDKLAKFSSSWTPTQVCF